MMKAFVFNKLKANPLFSKVELNKPTPKDDEVVIRVICASPNAADYRTIQMKMIPKHRVFGSAVSGIVDDVGSKVSNFQKGDEVFADLSNTNFGGLAEFTVTKESYVAKKPKQLSFKSASTLPVAASTALKSIRKIDLQKGDSLLVLGCSGGVGSYTLQIASYMGAKVTAVCSSKHVAQANFLGAHQVIDYKVESIFDRTKQYDKILAINGNYSLRNCLTALKKGGEYAAVGGALSQIFKAMLLGGFISMGGKKVGVVKGNPTQEELTFCAQLMAAGKLKPIIEKQFDFEETPNAMENFMKGHAKGKEIIEIDKGAA